MGFLLQVVGVVAGIVVVVAILRRTQAGATLTAVVALAAGAATVALVPAGQAALKELDAARTTPAAPREVAAAVPGIDVPFFGWVGQRVPPRATFALEPTPPNPLTRQWAAYQLAPRMQVEPEEADFVVLYQVDPRKADYDRDAFGPPQLFQPTLGLVERTDAG